MPNNKILQLGTVLAFVVMAGCDTRDVPPAIKNDPAIEEKIDELLGQMTLDEKIGQMTQLTFSMVADRNNYRLSEKLLDTVIGKYKVGSIFNAPFDVAQTPEFYADIIKRLQEKSIEVTGIPCVYGLDQIHGASYVLGSTLFPQGINMAASFNRDLAERGGEITAYESRGCGKATARIPTSVPRWPWPPPKECRAETPATSTNTTWPPA